jgi:hypothetical protein
MKSEEHILTNCPIEVASVATKALVDVLVSLGSINSIDDVPDQVSKLLESCNSKSNAKQEQQILTRFFESTKV